MKVLLSQNVIMYFYKYTLHLTTDIIRYIYNYGL
jgi:hypothetical protein